MLRQIEAELSGMHRVLPVSEQPGLPIHAFASPSSKTAKTEKYNIQQQKHTSEMLFPLCKQHNAIHRTRGREIFLKAKQTYYISTLLPLSL